MVANDRQVGGTHYKAKVEHWDLCCDYHVGYLESYSTKYLTRWRKSPKPLMDLDKTMHILEKLLEKIQSGHHRKHHIPYEATENFIIANDLEQDKELFYWIFSWYHEDDITNALKKVQQMYVDYDEPHYPGTPADGGHYGKEA
jgi:hypothetical protein